MINSILNTATSGLISTGLATNLRANNTVNVLTPGYTTQQPQRVTQGDPTQGGAGVSVVAKPGGPVELTTELVGLMQEEHSFKANAATFRTADEMYQEIAALKSDQGEA